MIIAETLFRPDDLTKRNDGEMRSTESGRVDRGDHLVEIGVHQIEDDVDIIKRVQRTRRQHVAHDTDLKQTSSVSKEELCGGGGSVSFNSEFRWGCLTFSWLQNFMSLISRRMRFPSTISSNARGTLQENGRSGWCRCGCLSLSVGQDLLYCDFFIG